MNDGETEAATDVLVLPRSVTIREVDHLSRQWQPIIGQNKGLCIDASANEQIDSAGLQLLLCIVRDLADRDLPVTLSQTSEAFDEVVGLLAMESSLSPGC